MNFIEFLSETKLSKKQNEIIQSLKNGLNIDITNHIEPSFTNNKVITIWTNELSDNDIRNIERWSNQYKKFRVEPNGHKKLALIL